MNFLRSDVSFAFTFAFAQFNRTVIGFRSQFNLMNYFALFRNFPSATNIQRKKEELARRVARGEVLQTKDFG